MKYSVILMSEGNLPHKMNYPLSVYHFTSMEKILDSLSYIANLLGNDYTMEQEDNVYTFKQKDGESKLIMAVQPIQWDILKTEIKINQLMP